MILYYFGIHLNPYPLSNYTTPIVTMLAKNTLSLAKIPHQEHFDLHFENECMAYLREHDSKVSFPTYWDVMNEFKDDTT